jgi:hypothetical protein
MLARMGARTRRQEGLRSARDESRPHFPLGLERSPMQAFFCFSNRVSPTAVSGGSGRNVGFAASVLIYQAQQRFRTANAYGIPVILERAVLLICSRHTTALSASGDRKRYNIFTGLDNVITVGNDNDTVDVTGVIGRRSFSWLVSSSLSGGVGSAQSKCTAGRTTLECTTTNCVYGLRRKGLGTFRYRW